MGLVWAMMRRKIILKIANQPLYHYSTAHADFKWNGDLSGHQKKLSSHHSEIHTKTYVIVIAQPTSFFFIFQFFFGWCDSFSHFLAKISIIRNSTGYVWRGKQKKKISGKPMLRYRREIEMCQNSLTESRYNKRPKRKRRKWKKFNNLE